MQKKWLSILLFAPLMQSSYALADQVTKKNWIIKHSVKCCFLINRFLLIKHKAVQLVTTRIQPLWINVRTLQIKWFQKGIILIFMVIAMLILRFMRCSHRIFILIKNSRLCRRTVLGWSCERFSRASRWTTSKSSRNGHAR